MAAGNVQYILIADDNPDITDVLSNYVKKEGFEPLVAGDGDAHVRRLLPQHIFQVAERLRAVMLRLTHAQHIQIRSIENEYMH